MKLACVEAIAALARAPIAAEVGAAYQGERLTFSPAHLIPKPLDPRLPPIVAHAAAQAVVSGVALRTNMTSIAAIMVERGEADSVAAARHVRRFGVDPQIALISDSEFGDLDTRSGQTMRAAIGWLDAAPRSFVYEGEMHVEASG